MSERYPSIEALKKAWQAGTDRHTAGRDCPTDESLYDAVHGRVKAKERRRIVAHLSQCGACAQSWRAAVELQRARPDIEQAAEWKRPAHRHPLNWTLAAAAAMAATMAIVWIVPRIDTGVPPPSDGSTLRGDERPAFELLTPDGTRQAAGALVLAWESIDGARVYRVRVSDANLATIHADTVEKTRITVPTVTLEDVGDGETLFWYVTAEMKDGTERRSETGTVVLDRTNGNT